MRRFSLIYRGPRAWLIWLNVLISCAALVPSLLQCFFALSYASGKYIGESAIVPGMFSALLLAAIGEKGYVVCVPVLLPACLLLPALLLMPRIPWRVKAVTAAVELAALVLMSRTVAMLNLQFQYGRFNGLFS
jgi:hypothetical protein